MVDRSLIKITILLLVSDPIARSVLGETLAREGYTVQATGDLGQAVELLKRCEPDLLITRTYVQGLPGHDAAVYLRTNVSENESSNGRGLHREALQGFVRGRLCCGA
jgi:CheY-like chemotaxis protein